MSDGKLTALQWQILARLAEMKPAWTLVGGGAIVGFYIPYRTTRDLDLFWRDLSELGDLRSEVADRLRASGLQVAFGKHSPAFARLEVRDGAELCMLDLVADPVQIVSPPVTRFVEGKSILVESHQELLANKLVAMLSRYELRDLADARALLKTGAKLDLALKAAPQKDGGFSAVVLAWVLESFPFANYRSEVSLPESELPGLEEFRAELIATLVTSTDPGDRVWERP